MGFDLENVDQMTGAIFTGAGGSMPYVWAAIAALICVVAIINGNRHEKEAYRKMGE